MIRRLLGELRRVVERQVAVDLVGGDVVVADAVLADGLQQAEGALHVRAQERLRVGDGVVVVGLGGVVHDRVVARDDAVQQPASQMSPTTSSTRSEGSPAMFSGLPA